MITLRSFILPVKGLKIGIHEFDYELDSSFFKLVNEESELVANFDVHVVFDKRFGMYVLDLELKGHYVHPCDRCLEQIQIPVEDSHRLYIKRGVGDEEADIVYLEFFDDEINIAKYIYEFVLVSFPLMNVIDCNDMENPPCNMKMLDKWEDISKEAESENKEGSIWDDLNNLNLE